MRNMKLQACLRAGLFAALLSAAQAQTTYTWDVNQGSAGTGGSGSWGTAAENTYWTANGASFVRWSDIAAPLDAVAFFGGTAGTVSLASSFSVHSLRFTSSGYTLTSGSTSTNRNITVSSGAVEVESGTATLGNVELLGSSGITKTGAGTLVLGTIANDEYIGPTTISAGTIQLGVTNSLRASSALTVSSGATLDLNGFSQAFTSTLAGSGTITNTGDTATLSLNATANTEFSGTISGNIALTKGAGSDSILTLSGASSNTYTGVTTVNLGTLALNKSGGVTAIAGNVVVGDGSTSTDALRLDASNQIADSSSVSLASNGVFNVNGLLETIGSLTGVSGSNVSLGGGSLTIGGTATSSYGGTVILGTGGTLTVGGTADAAFSGLISGAGSLTKRGSGVFTLSANNSYSGVTTIEGGTVSVASLAVGGTSSPLGGANTTASNLVINGGTLRYTGVGHTTNRLFTIGTSGAKLEANGSGAMSFTSSSSLAFSGSGARTLELSGSSTADNIFSPTIGNESGGGATSVVKSGTGKWIFTRTQTYTGSTSITEGTLALSGDGAVASSSTIRISLGATLDVSAITSGIFTIGASQTMSGAGTLNAGSKAVSFSGGLSPGAAGVGFLSITASTVTLSGTTIFDINGLTRGSQYDALDVTGSLAYGGTLSLTFSGSSITPGSTFDLFDFSSRSGTSTFSSISITNAGYLGTLDYSTGVFTVTAIPEPQAVTGILAASLVLFTLARGFGAQANSRHRKTATAPTTAG